MTDAELTRAVMAVYKNACAEIERLVKNGGVPVYRGKYGLRRALKHGDESDKLGDGEEVMIDIMHGTVGPGARDGVLVQATPRAVAKMRAKIAVDAATEAAREISRSSRNIIESEIKLRWLAKSGALSERRIRKILSEEKK